MRTRSVAYIATLLLLLVAACAAVPDPGPSEYDWCYRFDFTSSNTFNVAYGTWSSGNGYIPDAANQLALSYMSPYTVKAKWMAVGFKRIGYSSTAYFDSDVNWVINGVAFGISTSGDFFGTLDASMSEKQVSANNPSPGTGGTDVNINLRSTSPLAVEYLEIRGALANPFGADNCGAHIATSTPVPTGTPSPFPTVSPVPPTATTTLTITPSPTITPTPTATIVPNWCYTWDFTASSTGWSIGYGGSYSAGVGFISAVSDGNASLNITNSITASTVTSVQVFYVRGFAASGGTSHADINGPGGQYGGNLSSPAGTFSPTFTPNASINYIAFGIDTYAHTNQNKITRVTIQGNGTSPFGDNCSPTPTPTYTPTITLTPTITHTPADTLTPPPTSTLTPPPSWTPNPGAPTLPATGTATRTAIPVIPPTTRPTRTSTPPRTNTPGPTNTPGGPTQTANAHLTTTAQANATGTATVGGTPTLMLGTPNVDWTPYATGEGPANPGPGGNFGDGQGGEIADLGGSVIGGVSNMFNSASDWIGTLGQAGGIIAAWTNTAALAPPAAPRCVSAPMTYQLCAIWYLLTNTIFSGSVGTLILTVARVTVDLFCFFQFLKIGRAILSRVGKVLQ